MSLFNYKIENNDCSFNNNKKNIVLLIRRSPGEIDWILPLLFNIKNEYNIFTIFRSKSALSLTKENKVIFDLWKKTSFGYTVEPKLRSIFWRLSYKIFKKTFFGNYLKNRFQKKFFDVKLIENLILKNHKSFIPDAILLEFVNFSPWVDQYKIENKNLKTIHFPHTTNLFGIKKNKLKNKKKFFKNNLFLSSSYDYSYWKKKFSKFNIIETGYLKYDKLWLKNIIINKKKKKKKIIFLSLAGFVKDADDFDQYKKQINDIMDVCTKIPKFEILISAHPLTNNFELKKILNLYNKKKWKFVDDYHTNLIYLSDICICRFSSSQILDTLAMNKIPIELWNIRKKKYKSNFQKFTIGVKNKNDFKQTIESLIFKNIYNKKKSKIKKIFNRNFFINGSIIKTKKIFNKIIES